MASVMRALRRAAGLGAVLALTGIAGAQDQMPQQSVVERTASHDWVLNGTVRVSTAQSFDTKTGHPNRVAFDFTSAAVVFPIMDQCASSETKPPAAQYAMGETGGKLLLNHRVSDDAPTYLSGDYPCGTRLGKWVLTQWTGEVVELDVTIVATCWRTKFDEAAAQTLGWPEVWPALAQSTFKPQLFVDSMPAADSTVAALDMEPVKRLVGQWLEGRDPKSMPPSKLAKLLAGKVLEHVQLSGNGLNYGRTGEVEGFNLQGAAETAAHRRGSEFDAVCLLAAVYRTAGIPCRTVIGWDVGENKRDKKTFLSKNNGTKGFRAWVEFALPDPKSPGGLAWVPVDVVRMRKNSSRAQSLDRPWEYFGTHDELDGVIPIAFQFHPPTTVVAHGSPALWGWMVTPKPPERAEQAIRFEAVTEAVTPDTQEQKQQEKRDRRNRGH